MVFGVAVYFTVLVIVWGIRLNWKKEIRLVKRTIVWSPFFRIIMMTWFSTAIMAFTWLHAVSDGFENLNKIHGESAKMKGRGSKRRLEEFELNGLAYN
jgi:hypothetical protein